MTLVIFSIISCSEKKESTKIVEETDYEKKITKDSLFKTNLLRQYDDILEIDYYNNPPKYSIDYQNENKYKNYLLSPLLMDIYKSDSALFAKYFQSSYPNDFIFILKVDTNQIKIDTIKKFYSPKYLIASAKFKRLIDLKIHATGEIESENDVASDYVTIESEIEKGATIVFQGNLINLINK